MSLNLSVDICKMGGLFCDPLGRRHVTAVERAPQRRHRVTWPPPQASPLLRPLAVRRLPRCGTTLPGPTAAHAPCRLCTLSAPALLRQPGSARQGRGAAPPLPHTHLPRSECRSGPQTRYSGSGDVRRNGSDVDLPHTIKPLQSLECRRRPPSDS